MRVHTLFLDLWKNNCNKEIVRLVDIGFLE
jgi:hypothetical protein